ncbi:serine protease snake-like isoform X1 [Schistocerca americana]|uniref:serine protease snake-like isoform X1 n=2 Tax=Schistocerca americana TaxID=7009 RepID=UPI001F503879|nr:serine protease snake-like isoform X1 [Schistocerca americana]
MAVRRSFSRSGITRWALITIALLLVAATANAQRGEGDLCHSKYGGSGVCLHINSCPSAIRMVREGIVPDICGFRGSTAIVCCEDDAASNQLIAGDSPPRKPQRPPVFSSSSEDGGNSNFGNRPAQGGRPQYNEPGSQYRPGNNRPNTQTRPTAQQRPNNRPSSQYRPENNRPNSQYRPENNRPTTQYRPETGIPESQNRPSNSRPGSQFQPPTTQFGTTFSQQVRRSISEEKCDEYAKSVTERVEALPLLPNPDPVTIQVKKCDFEKLPLIVGGEKTVVGEFPHMAAIGYQNDGTLAWNCGGSLISEYYVLTAAHCTHSGKGPPVIVRLGELNLKRDDDGAHPVDYRIVDIVRHPEYKPPSKYNDIALLRLSDRVHFNKFLRPACLYTHDTFSVNKTVATGWGRIDYAEKPSETLLKVVLDIIDNKVCNNLWQSGVKISSLPRGIAPSMMCAGVLSGGKDTCQGDSGGPIQISSNRNHCVYYVIGVTSFGKYCAGKNSPGVYTRVSYFVPWIESIVWPDG